MKAIAKSKFNDLKEGVLRKPGDAFVCSRERFEEINSAGYGKLAEEVKEKPKK